MEKIIYALWREEAVPRDRFNSTLLEEIAPRLADESISLRINLQDTAVQGGTTFRYASTFPQMEAVAQVWVDTAHGSRRNALDDIVTRVAPRYSAWLVCESTPIRNKTRPPQMGERTYGYSHLAFVTRPAWLTWEAWRYRWQEKHTQVAIDTQSNFEYVQNLIVRPLTYAASPYSAIIEECFPPEAFTDDVAFHDAAGDKERYEANRRQLRESTFGFVEEGCFDLIPMSQFEIKPLRLS